MRYSNALTTPTPQSEPLDSRQVQNNAGGFVYTLDKWGVLDRFLILGSEGGTYYVQEKKLTKDNAHNLLACIAEDGLRTVQRIVEVSEQALAPKQTPGLFALAACVAYGNEDTRRAALGSLNQVARTASTFFTLLAELKPMRSLSGRMTRRAIQAWYSEKDVDALAYQMVKYRNRSGWTHNDVLRMAHPAGKSDPNRDALYHWAINGDWKFTEVAQPRLVEGFTRVQAETDTKVIAKLVADFGLPWEALPTAALKSPEVWEALVPQMPLAATVRNLGRLTNLGVITPTSASTLKILDKLGDANYIQRSRLHPMAVLLALKAYAAGRGHKGSLTWQPVGSITGALNEAFYAAFKNVEPTNKRYSLGIDVSGSMSAQIMNTFLSCCEAATAMAMVWVNTEKLAQAHAFNQGYQRLPLSKGQRLDDALRYTRGVNFGGTDCSLPMLDALQKKEVYDVFVVLTDNETWAGKMHPMEALRQYRREINPEAKLVVMGMASTGFTIADPNDTGSLDVVGFDSSVPQVVSSFVTGGQSTYSAPVEEEEAAE